MSDLAAAVSAIKVAIEIGKGLREAGLSLEKAEQKFKLAELMEALAEARTAVALAQEDLLTRDRQIRELQEKINLRGRMVYVAPCYWEDRVGKRDGPFCQQCYDSQQTNIRLQDYGDHWFCAACQNAFSKENRSRQTRVETEWDWNA